MPVFDKACAAIYRQDLPELESLVSRGNVVETRDSDGRTLLMHAILAEHPNHEIIKSLIRHGVDINAADKGQQWTALHFAARDQNIEVVRVLLENGAQIDPVDIFGNTPLWRAVMKQAPDRVVLELLLEYGADPEKKNMRGIAPIDMTRKTGRAELTQLFEESKR